jgi:glutaredoxin
MIKLNKYLISLFSISILFTFPSCADSKKDIAVGTMLNNKKNLTSIQLYVYHACPYCKRVIQYLKSSGNENKVQIIDASKQENLRELKRLNNNDTQCPFLYDPEKNVKMLESLDIIEYLKKRF